MLSEFEKYGLAVNRQEFEVEGSDGAFRDIEDIEHLTRLPEANSLNPLHKIVLYHKPDTRYD